MDHPLTKEKTKPTYLKYTTRNVLKVKSMFDCGDCMFEVHKMNVEHKARKVSLTRLFVKSTLIQQPFTVAVASSTSTYTRLLYHGVK